MGTITVLLAGETWVTYDVYQKGFNAIITGTYDEAASPSKRRSVRVGSR